jgi:hypothetical protein
MAQEGAAALQPLAATAGAPGAAPSLQLLTISAGAPGGQPSLAQMTSSGASASASVAAGDCQFERATATGAASAGSVAEGDGELEALTAEAYPPVSVALELSALTAEGTGLTGTVASAQLVLESLSVESTSVGGSIAAGSPSFEYAVALAIGVNASVGSAALELRSLRASGSALNGSVASGAPELEPLGASATHLAIAVLTADAYLAPMVAHGVSSPTYTDTVRTWSLNVGREALTEYQNFPFLSYAEFAGAHYAAGPDGIFRLEGEQDNGEDVNWSFSTGFIDAKVTTLKRLEEVLLAIRFDGPLRIRVWTDEATYFDYNVSNFRPDVVHQVRAKLGKGLRSRFYRVQVAALSGATAEVHSMQLPMIPLQRRLG